MHKVLFVCHGNICRSPMAEFIMKDLAAKAGAAGLFEIDSAAVSREEEGNSIYPPARRELQRHGVPCQGHAAHQITRAELDSYDIIYYMEASSIKNKKEKNYEDLDQNRDPFVGAFDDRALPCRMRQHRRKRHHYR